jgi:hypothetical protein
MIVQKEFQEKSLLLYRGTLTVNLISILSNHIRLLLSHDFKALQKIFKIFIELSQSVSYYSAETFEVNTNVFCGIGWVSVQDTNEFYQVTTGNVIKPGDAETLKKYCQEINSLSEEELRKLKREIRSEALSRETGAHIGLIQTSIISSNPLEFLIEKDDEGKTTFTLTATIRKEPA